jgi:glutaminase
VHEVAGDLRFVEAERVLRSLEEEPEGEEPVVLDLERVHRVNDVARRMLLEGVRRLHLDGHDVRLVDPSAVLGGDGQGPDAGDGYVPEVFEDAAAAVGE